MPSVCIFGHEKNHLIIEQTEIDLGDQSFDVSVVQGWFRGATQVCCAASDLQHFVEQLRECERL